MDDSFEDRERRFEARSARDQETLSRVRLRRDRLFASWASDQLGEEGPPGYAEALVGFARGRKSEDLIGKVVHDLHGYGVAATDAKVRRGFEICAQQALREVTEAV